MKLRAIFIWVVFLSYQTPALAQIQIASLEEAAAIAKTNNNYLKAEYSNYEALQSYQRSYLDFGKTRFYYDYDENNITPDGFNLNVYGIAQNIPFPTYLSSQKKYFNSQTDAALHLYNLKTRALERDVQLSYNRIQYLANRISLVTELDSLADTFIRSSNKRFEVGEIDVLEVANLKATLYRLEVQRINAEQDFKSEHERMKELLNVRDSLTFLKKELIRLSIDTLTLRETPTYKYFQTMNRASDQYAKVLRNDLWPEIGLEYYLGVERTENPTRNYNGYGLALSLPLFFNAQSSRIQAAKIQNIRSQQTLQAFGDTWSSRLNNLLQELIKFERVLAFYDAEGLPNAVLLGKAALSSYTSGEYDISELILAIQSSVETELEYLEVISDYNEVVIRINYLDAEDFNNYLK